MQCVVCIAMQHYSIRHRSLFLCQCLQRGRVVYDAFYSHGHSSTQTSTHQRIGAHIHTRKQLQTTDHHV